MPSLQSNGKSQLRRRWQSTGLVQDTGVCGVMIANRLSFLVPCFSDWFFFPSEVNTKDLSSAFMFKKQWKREACDFFQLSLAAHYPSLAFLWQGTSVAGSPLPCTWFPVIFGNEQRPRASVAPTLPGPVSSIDCPFGGDFGRTRCSTRIPLATRREIRAPASCS